MHILEPFIAPSSFKTLANLFTSELNWLYVIFFDSLGSSPSQISAILLPFFSRCLSIQFSEILIFPPANHFVSSKEWLWTSSNSLFHSSSFCANSPKNLSPYHFQPLDRPQQDFGEKETKIYQDAIEKLGKIIMA